MIKISFQIKSFLSYKLKAINVHHLHSPFAYGLVDRVVNDKKAYPDFKKVQELRNMLQADHSEIMVTDFGAGIGGKGYALIQKNVASLYINNSIRAKYGKLLYRLVRHFQPAAILELGTSLGVSTAYMALAAPKAAIITVEGSKAIAEKAAENFRRLDITNIQQETGSFDSILNPVIEKMARIDLAFIDGNHRKEPTIRYFESCLKKSHNDTVLIFDDIHWSPEMNEAWHFIQSHPSVTLTLDLFQFGIVFFRKELSKEDFIISY